MSQPESASNHETAFVMAFVAPEKRDRYLQFLPRPKKRSEILNRLCHNFDFIATHATLVARQNAESLVELLRSKGAGVTAHLIGGSQNLDGTEMSLSEAIDHALDYGGAIVSCIPGRLALLIQEFPPGDTYVLSRR
jgi:hypothetical protein